MKKGVIVVQASVAVAVGDPVYYVPATGVLTNVARPTPSSRARSGIPALPVPASLRCASANRSDLQ
jgi:hypothetical protein